MACDFFWQRPHLQLLCILGIGLLIGAVVLTHRDIPAQYPQVTTRYSKTQAELLGLSLDEILPLEDTAMVRQTATGEYISSSAAFEREHLNYYKLTIELENISDMTMDCQIALTGVPDGFFLRSSYTSVSFPEELYQFYQDVDTFHFQAKQILSDNESQIGTIKLTLFDLMDRENTRLDSPITIHVQVQKPGSEQIVLEYEHTFSFFAEESDQQA